MSLQNLGNTWQPSSSPLLFKSRCISAVSECKSFAVMHFLGHMRGRVTHSTNQLGVKSIKILRFNGFPVNHVDATDDYDPEDVIAPISMGFVFSSSRTTTDTTMMLLLLPMLSLFLFLHAMDGSMSSHLSLFVGFSFSTPSIHLVMCVDVHQDGQRNPVDCAPRRATTYLHAHNILRSANVCAFPIRHLPASHRLDALAYVDGYPDRKSQLASSAADLC